ncbi:hypothetical protein PIIN_08429 [Serendipita indica DSM 11827]|uniref:Uncharacterized protein n=1 Tax=Serendipita indica (strain DSM 11827) TaxID=1109443 RepID=G4TT33_SERID|nr:hypothetical protein PIIN_08429 [Serendipita indica DSM 11827]
MFWVLLYFTIRHVDGIVFDGQPLSKEGRKKELDSFFDYDDLAVLSGRKKELLQIFITIKKCSGFSNMLEEMRSRLTVFRSSINLYKTAEVEVANAHLAMMGSTSSSVIRYLDHAFFQKILAGALATGEDAGCTAASLDPKLDCVDQATRFQFSTKIRGKEKQDSYVQWSSRRNLPDRKALDIVHEGGGRQSSRSSRRSSRIKSGSANSTPQGSSVEGSSGATRGVKGEPQCGSKTSN